ncbi:unnamed protein product [Periconia digitata]|uniref:Uncharacterized protein n=1 Tax=Periconia digitata TaxID=1303443 RepID=A0A9W4U7G1_9PLEO|nr:unnamed protein product [Periconia digitata]
MDRKNHNTTLFCLSPSKKVQTKPIMNSKASDSSARTPDIYEPWKTLTPEIYDEWDEDEDKLWKASLESLINGEQTPFQASQNIDAFIREVTSSRLTKLIEYADTHDVTAEERQFGIYEEGIYVPDASTYANVILRTFGKACTAFPPRSETQNRLVGLLEELRGLPRWMAPELGPDEKGQVNSTEFWKFGGIEESWIGLEDAFRREHAVLKPTLDRDHHPCELHARWRNLQHIMARITASDLIYCGGFNALSDLVPSIQPNKDPTRYKKRNMDFSIIAAAQWVVGPHECRFVYHECLKRETIEHFWKPWSKEGWAFWKIEFANVIDNTHYDERTQVVAREALQQMETTEKQSD